jgi:hypothetical protein
MRDHGLGPVLFRDQAMNLTNDDLVDGDDAMTWLLLSLSLLSAPRAEAPLIEPDAATIRFDEIGLYAVGLAYRGQPEQTFPIGWGGPFDPRTGVACEPAGEQNGRPAFVLHPPWRGGTGIAFQEFRFRVPDEVKAVRVEGATAMRADSAGPGKSDGVTFRVIVNQQSLMDVHQADSAWRAFSFPVPVPASREVTVRFETDPGPKGNSSFDFALWADRSIHFDGKKLIVKLRVPVPSPSLAGLSARPDLGARPATSQPVQTSTRRDGEAIILNAEGPEGSVRYRWERPTADDDPPLGKITAEIARVGTRPVTVPVATTSSIEWAGPTRPTGPATWAPGENIGFDRAYRLPDGKTATISVRAQLANKALAVSVRCDQPGVTRFSPGDFGPTLRRRVVPVPYYSNQVFYRSSEDVFTASWLDWTASAATSHRPGAAEYLALTDGQRAPLNETAVHAVSWHLAEVLPNVPNPPSPFLKDVGGRIVLDIWGGAFRETARDLATLAEYGVDRCVTIAHVWQRDGYDNALPAHVPAAAGQGGDAGMKDLVATGVKLGHLVALHENYVDYYPNYEKFDVNDIALDSSGEKQKAWYNPGTKVQSFAVKPTAILRLAGEQSPEIHKRYGTNANYLDVHSAVPPWFHVDQRAGEPGAGRFATVFDTHQQLFQYERDTHKGPVFGEGNNHWYWSGLLDGVEAQFGSGWPGEKGESAPLMVDFDLLKIHPLQVNHGMGYYERWWEGAYRRTPTMRTLDQYRMQEVAFGHAGFLAARTWNVVPLAWLEHHMMTPVSSRYATAKPTRIQYKSDGGWVDTTRAAKLGAWDRVQVTYDSGLVITANQSAKPLQVGNHVLPQFGWLAEGAGLTAGTTLRDGAFSDFAESSSSVFVNARRASDWDLSGVAKVRPSVALFRPKGARAFTAGYRWEIGQALNADHVAFVHFVPIGKNEGEDDGAIAFQQDHPPSQPTSRWRAGMKLDDGPYEVTVPPGVADGAYAWTIGLYRPGGPRLRLEGPTDAEGRVVLGTITIGGGGRTIRFEPKPDEPIAPGHDPLAHLNRDGKPIDFGAIRTDLSVLVRKEGTEWVARIWPRDAKGVVELSSARFGRPESIRGEGGPAAEIKPVPASSSSRWSLPIRGARSYRWPAG